MPGARARDTVAFGVQLGVYVALVVVPVGVLFLALRAGGGALFRLLACVKHSL